MTRRRTIYSTVVFSLLLVSSAIFAEDQAIRTVEVMPNLGMMEQIVRQIVPKIEDIRGSWDFQATVTNAEDAPAVDAKVTLRWKDDDKNKQEVLTTDAKGQAIIKLTSERLDGLVLDIPKDCKVKFAQGGDVKLVFGRTERVPTEEDKSKEDEGEDKGEDKDEDKDEDAEGQGEQQPEPKDLASGKHRSAKVMPQIGIPVVVLKRLVSQFEDSGGTFNAVAILTTSTGKPATDVEVKLHWEGGSEMLMTDAKGEADFALTPDRFEALTLDYPAHLTANFAHDRRMKIEVKAGRGGSKAVPIEKILKEYSLLKVGEIEVFFKKGHEKEGARALADLAAMRGFARGYAGLELKMISNYGVVLTSGDGAKAVEGRILIPLPLEAYSDTSSSSDTMTTMGSWILMHEWVEGTIVFTTFAYREDARLRFMGDGLAELLSYQYCRRYHPEAAKHRLASYIGRAMAMQRKDIDTFDFTTDFMAEGTDGSGSKSGGTDRPLKIEAGYGMAFLFWYQVAEKGGPDAIRKVMNWVMETEGMNLESVIAKANEACGGDFTSKTDVAKAIEVFERLLAQ